MSQSNYFTNYRFPPGTYPDELKGLPQWVVWKLEIRDGKKTKIPYTPRGYGVRAEANNPRSWGTYSEACEAFKKGHYSGIGFELSPPYVGIDYDGVRDPESGQISDDIMEEIFLLNSYTEISPSESGIHVIIKGKIPGDRRRTSGREMYSNGRFFTMTGNRVSGTPETINEGQQALETVYSRWFGNEITYNQGPPVPPSPSTIQNPITDEEIMHRISSSAKGKKYRALMEGRIDGYPSHSEADLALCNILSDHTSNKEQIDRIFRDSKLFREKWDQQRGSLTYGEITIASALKKNSIITAGSFRRINITGRRLREISENALTALSEVNDPPKIFVRSGKLSRIATDELGVSQIEIITEYALRGILERCSEFVRNKSNKSFDYDEKINTIEIVDIPVSPPMEVVRDILTLGRWDLPPLKSIIEAPTILRDNTLIVKDGYDRTTQLFYCPSSDLILPLIPDNPTDDNVKKAISLIEEIFCDFPFDSPASKANTLGALMTAVLRPMIPGNIPLVLFDKPQAGTGATLLAEVIALVSTGRYGSMMTAPSSDEEWKKAITSILLQGRSVVVVDNIEGKLFSPSLAAVLTSQVWQDRILGRSEMITAPNTAVWIGTGNNIQLGGDMPRRCYWVRMDAERARPWQRTEYRHPHLKDWIIEERGNILASILTVARVWILAGKPAPTKIPTLGGFEGWRDTIGGILEHAGIEGFLGNLEKMYEAADVDTPQWEAFYACWSQLWLDKSVTTAEIEEQLSRESGSHNIDYTHESRLLDTLPDTLMDAWTTKRSFVRIFGRALAKRDGQVLPNGLCLVKDGTSHRAVKWKVIQKTTQQAGLSHFTSSQSCGIDERGVRRVWGVSSDFPAIENSNGNDVDVIEASSVRGGEINSPNSQNSPPIETCNIRNSRDIPDSIETLLNSGKLNKAPDLQSYKPLRGPYNGRCIHAGCNRPPAWIHHSTGLNPLCNEHYHLWESLLAKVEISITDGEYGQPEEVAG